MPIKTCQRDKKPGFKWGDEGKCFTYEPGNERSRQRAMRKAKEQGRAIEANRQSEGR